MDEPLWSREQMEAAFAARFAPARRPASPTRRPASAASKHLRRMLPTGPAAAARSEGSGSARSPKRQPAKRAASHAQERESPQRPLYRPSPPMRRRRSRSPSPGQALSAERNASLADRDTDSEGSDAGGESLAQPHAERVPNSGVQVFVCENLSMAQSRATADAAVQAGSDPDDHERVPDSHPADASGEHSHPDERRQAAAVVQRCIIPAKATSEEPDAPAQTAGVAPPSHSAGAAAGICAEAATSRSVGAHPHAMLNRADTSSLAPASLVPGLAADLAPEPAQSSDIHREGHNATTAPPLDSVLLPVLIDRQAQSWSDEPSAVSASSVDGLLVGAGNIGAASADGSPGGAASASEELEAAELLQRALHPVVSVYMATPDTDPAAVEQLQRSRPLSAEIHLEELADIAAQLQQVD